MPMMLKIFLHRLLRDVTRAPRSVAYRPEVAAPVPLAQRRILFLEPAARAPLHPLDEVAERPRRRVLDVHVDMVFAHHALQYPHVLGVAYLHEQVAATRFDVPDEHLVAVLRDPDDVRRQPRDAMATVAVLFHAHDFYHRAEVCSN